MTKENQIPLTNSMITPQKKQLNHLFSLSNIFLSAWIDFSKFTKSYENKKHKIFDIQSADKKKLLQVYLENFRIQFKFLSTNKYKI